MLYQAIDNEYLSPLIYRGAAPVFDAGISYRNGPFLWVNNMLLSGANLSSGKSDVLDTTIKVETFVAADTALYFRMIKSRYGSLSGGALTDMQVEMYRLVSSRNASAADKRYEFGAFGFAPALRYEYGFARHSLTLGFYMPLAYYVVRRQWFLYDDMLDKKVSDPVASIGAYGEMAYINEIVKIPIEAGYRYSFNNKIGLVCSYRYTLLSYKKPRTVTTEYQLLCAGIEVTF